MRLARDTVGDRPLCVVRAAAAAGHGAHSSGSDELSPKTSATNDTCPPLHGRQTVGAAPRDGDGGGGGHADCARAMSSATGDRRSQTLIARCGGEKRVRLWAM